MNKNNEWAVVTGVSKGLGFLYAEELLKKGYNILGVARDTTLVTSIIKKYPDQKIVLINCDLAKVANVYTFYEQCQNYNVTLVINNAGFGVWGTFCKTDLAQELNMIALNIATLHILTKLFLKKFIVNNNGRIINIASLAALTPGPGFSSYYASKAYVLNLSVAINTELKLQKLRPRVITICPGPLKTDFWNRASANKVNKKRTKYTPAFPTMGISKFISKSLDKALATNNKNYIVIGFWNHLMLIISKILPKKLVLKKVYKHQINR